MTELQSQILDQLNNIDWNFSDADTSLYTHRIHPYPAKFIPQIPNNIIKMLSKKDDVVLDPFCGSGTTLVEAKILGRPSIGVDINPLSCLISKVKATQINKSSIDIGVVQLKSNIIKKINLLYSQQSLENNIDIQLINQEVENVRLPNFHNRDYWFSLHVLNELSIIKEEIYEITNKDLREFLLVALSSIIVRVSNQDSNTRYVRRDKQIKPRAALRQFIKAVDKMSVAMELFNEVATNVSLKIVCEDSRNLSSIEDESINLVVTSPPYLNAWDYHLYHRFRMFWLGMDPVSLRKKEIGAHLEHSYNLDSIERYMNDMRLVIEEMYRVLKWEGFFVIVIGNSIVKGTIVDSSKYFLRLAKKIGFEIVKIIQRDIKAQSKSFNPKIGNIKTEHILFFNKVKKINE